MPSRVKKEGVALQSRKKTTASAFVFCRQLTEPFPQSCEVFP
jgi:hypothetical protein